MSSPQAVKPELDPKAMFGHSLLFAKRAVGLRNYGAREEAKPLFLAAAQMAEDALKILLQPPIVIENLQILSALILLAANCFAAAGEFTRALEYTAQCQALRMDPYLSREMQKLATKILARHRSNN